MTDVSLLDCTLRDGGYVNHWEFGHSVITGTYRRLEEAGVEFIEVGFLNDSYPFCRDNSICPNTQSFNRIFEGVSKGHSIPVAMIDYGTCSIEHIEPASESFIDGIRVIFKKEKIEQALPFCREIKQKGYKLFIQAISITDYSKQDLQEYVKKVNEIHPFAFSIVDTYGLLDEEKLNEYFQVIEELLLDDIRIGYHAHNNFQLGFSNSMKFLGQSSRHSLVVDATIYGMGKSAGNCPEELIALHMNSRFNKQYKIDSMLEILDNDLMAIYQKQYWGYRYNYFISAMQNCHPDYVKYLLDRKTLSISAVNDILREIPQEQKLRYDAAYIQNAYYDYQSKAIDDNRAIESLSAVFSHRTVLLIGPGSSLNRCRSEINAYEKQYDTVNIGVNFTPAGYRCDWAFVSNAKRFARIADEHAEGLSGCGLIITSNISPFGILPDYTLNYRTLISQANAGSDNALILLLTALIRMGVNKVGLCGFDGFRAEGNEYVDKTMSFAGNDQYRIESNKVLANAIREARKKIAIDFVTPSVYEELL